MTRRFPWTRAARTDPTAKAASNNASEAGSGTALTGPGPQLAPQPIVAPVKVRRST